MSQALDQLLSRPEVCCSARVAAWMARCEGFNDAFNNATACARAVAADEGAICRRRKDVWRSEGYSPAQAAEEPADQGADDASHEHSLQHVRELYLQGYEVQFAQGGRRRRGKEEVGL